MKPWSVTVTRTPSEPRLTSVPETASDLLRDSSTPATMKTPQPLEAAGALKLNQAAAWPCN